MRGNGTREKERTLLSSEKRRESAFSLFFLRTNKMAFDFFFFSSLFNVFNLSSRSRPPQRRNRATARFSPLFLFSVQSLMRLSVVVLYLQNERKKVHTQKGTRSSSSPIQPALARFFLARSLPLSTIPSLPPSPPTPAVPPPTSPSVSDSFAFFAERT